ncbi:MAG: IS5 family transposase [Holosporales bacterium]|nr:IS5 family transposase [Holosporales bacterium]
MKQDAIRTLSNEEFRRLTGIKKRTFEDMVKILNEARAQKHSRGGHPNKVQIEDALLMTLEYLREYRTYFHISQSYGISESYAYKTIRWVEDTLIKSKLFRLPGRKTLIQSDVEYEVILVDATESPIQRPKKKQKQYYSGKKKRHTIKSQVVVDKSSKTIICTNFSNGKRHNFRLFKESKVRFQREIKVLADTGYQGIHKIHFNSQTPKKRTRKNLLSTTDQRENHLLSSKRVLNENIIGMLKRFKIVADKYRNRRKRFGLRFNLIAGIYNYGLVI